jgi:thymidine kinase
MFSGKSTEMLRRVRRYQAAKRRCLVIKYARDTRYGKEDTLITHDRCDHNNVQVPFALSKFCAALILKVAIVKYADGSAARGIICALHDLPQAMLCG